MTRLDELEQVIQESLSRKHQTWEALGEIRTDRLWESAGYESFAHYCRERWHISRSHAHELAAAGDYCRDLPHHQRPNTLTDVRRRRGKRTGRAAIPDKVWLQWRDGRVQHAIVGCGTSCYPIEPSQIFLIRE